MGDMCLCLESATLHANLHESTHTQSQISVTQSQTSSLHRTHSRVQRVDKTPEVDSRSRVALGGTARRVATRVAKASRSSTVACVAVGGVSRAHGAGCDT